jgi:hypothetical protein
MGVHGLWDLLAPAGRRVSLDSVERKRIAVDASIWLVQFLKAMRDKEGAMIKNAHLIGMFRRLCKLLFLRTKPVRKSTRSYRSSICFSLILEFICSQVLVFDGGAPALKQKTTQLRRMTRMRNEKKFHRTAEKLLLNELKRHSLLSSVSPVKLVRLVASNTPTSSTPKKQKASQAVEVDESEDDIEQQQSPVLPKNTAISKLAPDASNSGMMMFPMPLSALPPIAATPPRDRNTPQPTQKSRPKTNLNAQSTDIQSSQPTNQTSSSVSRMIVDLSSAVDEESSSDEISSSTAHQPIRKRRAVRKANSSQDDSEALLVGVSNQLVFLSIIFFQKLLCSCLYLADWNRCRGFPVATSLHTARDYIPNQVYAKDCNQNDAVPARR